MVWFFLTGMIAGVVGTVMLARHMMRKHITLIRFKENMDETGDSDEDLSDY